MRECRSLPIGTDSTKIFVNPCGNIAVHNMVKGTRSAPPFPECCGAGSRPKPPTRIFCLGKHPVYVINIPIFTKNARNHFRTKNSKFRMMLRLTHCFHKSFHRGITFGVFDDSEENRCGLGSHFTSGVLSVTPIKCPIEIRPDFSGFLPIDGNIPGISGNFRKADHSVAEMVVICSGNKILARFP